MFGGYTYKIVDKSVTSKRIEWIDLMKAIGIYLIVLGHFFSLGDKYVYVFNVPFFLISGFLCKKEPVVRDFWNKLWYNLVVPMLIISTINYLYGTLKNGAIDILALKYFIIHVFLGFHAGIGTCWFVYTLILLKIIHQYSPKHVLYVFCVLSFFMAYIWNHFDFPNCVFRR